MAVLIADKQNILKVKKANLKKFIKEVLSVLGEDFSISLVLTDNALIKELNSRYLKRNEPTDVLSFSLDGGPQPLRLKGEVIVSVEEAKNHAYSFGNSVSREIALYVVHGILHLLGYKDKPSALRGKMKKKEEMILSDLDSILVENIVYG